MLDVSARPIVIVGGGRVAARKARLLVDCGATRVRVVAPFFAAELPLGLELVEAHYQPEHLYGASLVFAATNDPKVNGASGGRCARAESAGVPGGYIG